ncbi:DnaA regulatory inactivator Hda [Limimonas halophila]|uniref:DnaA regulatory inactivator Hda n=1 Tax=Limimonas halophila TaxID=1082479 RepID=A0A1G7PA44_9PROT|nr:DnaA/Hda family protein [Limimonas halophila]SDF82469.1 DnaA regulatory inactivator Hda [Limimonas halophila]
MSENGRQLPLDLPHRPALGRADFLVAPANEVAVAWLDRWPEWPGSVLVLTGPAGSGKTHLAAVWQRMSGAVALDGAALAEGTAPAELLGDATAAVLDDADALFTAGDHGERLERQLLHLVNHMREAGGHLLITAREHPSRWPVALPDLASRLAAAAVADLGPPDDQLIAAVLVKLFADRQLKVPPEVVRFLLPRMERSFAAARRIVAALDHASLAAKREITVPLARDVLAREGDATGHVEPGEPTSG